MKTASLPPSSTWIPVGIAESQVIHLVSPRTALLIGSARKELLIFVLFLVAIGVAVFVTRVL